MTGMPGLQVLLDDGTGTFPYDVSSFVRMKDSITFQRGRSDEQSDNSPGSFSLTFDNTDGRFTVGSPTYGIALDRKVRLKYTSPSAVTEWTGQLQGLPVSWPAGGQEFAVVKATATDPLAPLARAILRSASQEEILADAPAAYWPLDDDPPNVLPDLLIRRNLVDGLVPLAVNIKSSAFPSHTDLGTPDGAAGNLFTSDVSGLSSSLNRLDGRPAFVSSSLHAEVAFVIQAGFTGNLQLIRIQNPGFTIGFSGTPQIYYNRAGGLDTNHSVGPVSLADGLPHVVAVETDATTTHVFIDGVLVDSRAGLATTYDTSQVAFGVDVGNAFTAGSTQTIVIGHVNFGAKISDARAIAHANAILTDFSGETPAARITRVCGYLGIPTGSLDTAGTTICGTADQGDRDALAVLQETAAAGLGDAFADGNGAIAYVSGATIASRATPDATIDANLLAPDMPVLVDMASIVNISTGSRPDTTITYGVSDPTSIGAPGNHGRYPKDFTWNVNSDAQVQDRTNWMVNNYSDPSPRISELTIDLLTAPGATVTALLGVDLTRYLRVTGMPSQTPGGTTQDLIVYGMSSTLTLSDGDASWTLTLNVAPRAQVGAWILDDPTWSVLGSTTKLYIG